MPARPRLSGVIADIERDGFVALYNRGLPLFSITPPTRARHNASWGYARRFRVL